MRAHPMDELHEHLDRLGGHVAAVDQAAIDAAQQSAGDSALGQDAADRPGVTETVKGG